MHNLIKIYQVVQELLTFKKIATLGRKMAIENAISNDFWYTLVDSINVFDCHLSGMITVHGFTYGINSYFFWGGGGIMCIEYQISLFSISD